ncbi:MAG: extracellular solute-binding protein [Acidobacteriota bacterium]
MFYEMPTLAGCSAPQRPTPVLRIGVPPILEPVFADAPESAGINFSVVPLRPYSRAHDLEVLLFSTRSQAFDGIVVQARFIPLFSKWAQPFPQDQARLLNPLLGADGQGKGGLTALPITIDAPVLIYRADLWKQYKLPPPRNLAALREDMLNLRSWEKDLSHPVASSVQENVLFWSLAYSYAGQALHHVYRYPESHVLGFMAEFGLRTEPIQQVKNQLQSGQTAVVFCMASDVSTILGKDAGSKTTLAVAALPARKSPIALNNGWCLMAYGLEGHEQGHLERLLGKGFQQWLSKRGYFPAAKEAEPPRGATSKVLSHYSLAPSPLGWEDEIIVGQAIQDALAGVVDPEEALRRAEARISAREDKP